MSKDFNTAFQDAVHCYNILKNEKVQCFQNQKDLKSENVQRAVTFAAAALIRDSALCEAQYAVFSVFKMFEFNTFTSLPSNFTTTTDCENTIHTVLQTFLRNIEFLKISDQASFEQLKNNVVESYPTFSAFHKKIEEVSSLEQLKAQVERYKTYLSKEDGTLMREEELKTLCALATANRQYRDKQSCNDAINRMKSSIPLIEQQISEYTKCDKSGGGKKSKKSKRSRKQTRRRRRLRKHKHK